MGKRASARMTSHIGFKNMIINCKRIMIKTHGTSGVTGKKFKRNKFPRCNAKEAQRSKYENVRLRIQ
jgi:hypothetical protein